VAGRTVGCHAHGAGLTVRADEALRLLVTAWAGGGGGGGGILSMLPGGGIFSVPVTGAGKGGGAGKGAAVTGQIMN